ncbi:hypothetical protein DPMN_043824 [Dreissena polymorpha]|uniref:Uncharacterized protein n=1 Tax=Dreissena polymorpha TaxID=45954 RepID=A0A9D4HYC4_DREPO|nr:hypothetical protein DPMN_043824 [Dreissena polymorpha]
MLPITSGHLLPDILLRYKDRPGTCRRLPDGVRQSPKPSRHLQKTPRQFATVQRPSGQQAIPKQSSAE